jgi:hypothetical protein
MDSFWKQIGVKGANFMNTNRTVNWMAIAAIVFGAMTALAGGRALFGSLESRAETELLSGHSVSGIFFVKIIRSNIPLNSK